MKCIVRPLKQKDAGRGLAAVDSNTAEELDLETSDFIAIIGKNGVLLRASGQPTPRTKARGLIRIDRVDRDATGDDRREHSQAND